MAELKITAFLQGEEGKPTTVPNSLLDEELDPAMFDGETFTLRYLIADHTNLWLGDIHVRPPVNEIVDEIERAYYRGVADAMDVVRAYDFPLTERVAHMADRLAPSSTTTPKQQSDWPTTGTKEDEK